MGQKANSYGFRVGPTLNKIWDINFYAKGKEYTKKLHEGLKIILTISKNYTTAEIGRTHVGTSGTKIVINIPAKKPRIILGKNNSDIEKLKNQFQLLTSGEIFINLNEVKKFELDARISAQEAARQVENRVSFRRVIKTTVKNLMGNGAKGVKIALSGRLGGAEIARTEWHQEGKVPLHNLRADIDYATAVAHTIYGAIGIKLWINKGEIDPREFDPRVKKSNLVQGG